MALPHLDTPNLDRLTATGLRFDRAYTTCPRCTPARSAIFSGTHPVTNGAWCNNVPPYATTPLLGTILRHYGYRAAYTGKWHLDGTGYFGDGVPGGGFEPDWWYDGKCYAADIGPETFRHYLSCRTATDLRRAGFTAENIWGHRVANRAIDFLERVGDNRFVLAMSFDEPHGPCVAPPEYWEKFTAADLPPRPNRKPVGADRPLLQQIQQQQANTTGMDPSGGLRFLGYNSFIDREIGCVIDTVQRLHGDDTMIIYTSDHGDMLGAHGLVGKGPMMYEELCNIPFIVRLPGGPQGATTSALASHTDIVPTILDFAGIERPECLQGVSLRPVLENPQGTARETALVSFSRFAINHDDWGEFYPIRCLTDGRHKLVINLFETDELYDLATDPGEMTNLINDPAHHGARDRLHDALLAEMDRIRDPFRSFRWGHRAWRQVRQPFYFGGRRRDRPTGFPFQTKSLEATGVTAG